MRFGHSNIFDMNIKIFRFEYNRMAESSLYDLFYIFESN